MRCFRTPPGMYVEEGSKGCPDRESFPAFTPFAVHLEALEAAGHTNPDNFHKVEWEEDGVSYRDWVTQT
jgi:hypothetical protein